ncbi:MAG: ATP-binding protein [Candidatus Marinimicrobia bacterium]|jgi:hypothetical protein|nr:ATP-binding protein [Candidatus Neomarinimicrobiota bacterium]MBT3497155.1 ATP-binding protein [Candidatus Neomarinimicrobiota bacterium]MBT3691895.1 ATP-binding protein [Candidatus Neomarinimicrobiota bacterium]MBT3732615.1 ATP-binding protein [Candidatus Neomarinimicrobiota bacterium]MBT4144242.1 ATP-binding protein [Candidatus Neomarinimicrobiota bacterium]
MINRKSISKKVIEYCQIFPVVAIVGPRQVGKTTLVKALIPSMKTDVIYLDLERPSDLSKLDHPELFLMRHKNKCVILDEIQCKPNLFPLIRSLVDEQKRVGSFIILGSASPTLLKQSSETLAGRIGYIELGPFSIPEIYEKFNFEKHLFLGGFPVSYLSPDDKNAKIWLENFIKTYLERDLHLLGLTANPVLIRRLWEMLAWQTGGLLNQNSLSKSLGVSNHTINRYIGFFEGAFLAMKLQPFTINIKKRLVKTPKIYIRDTGLLHSLLRVVDYEQLLGNPLLGNIFETYIINQVMLVKKDELDLYFYRTHAGAEIDLVIAKGLTPICSVEIKFSSAPKISRGFMEGIASLQTSTNFIIIPKDEDYLIDENIRVIGFNKFINEVLPKI